MKNLILVLVILLFVSKNIAAQYYKIELVKDINLGATSSDPQDLVKAGNNLYFSANNGINGSELWKSDGTAAGTQMLMDINNVGSNSSSPNYLTVMNGNVYFTATDGTNGYELWRSQFSGAGAGFTGIVKDIELGANSSYPTYITNMNGLLIFRANTEAAGAELWKSNGTSAGTQLIEDFIPGDIGLSPANWTGNNTVLPYFETYNGATYFSSGLFNHGNLYQSTSSNISGPILVDGYDEKIFPNYIKIIDGTVFMTGYGNNGGVTIGREMFIKRLGENVQLLKDINVGEGDSYPYDHINVNGSLFFTANNGTARSLWKSDGTSIGTVIVKTITNDTHFNNFCEVAGKLFFKTYNTNGVQLWKSDGTTNGTVLVKTINSTTDESFDYIIDFNGKLVFTAYNATFGQEIWQSDGTEAGTFMIKDLNPTGNSDAQNLTKVNDVLYFTANNGVNGKELYKMYNCYGPEFNFTTKNGNWNDPTVWSCGRIPTTTEQITIKGNTININGNFGVNRIIFEGGNITIPVGSTLTYYPIIP